MVDAGLEASIAVPIRGAERRVIGVLALAWDHPITADRALIGVVQRMAEVAGQALTRASITDRSTARARSLAVFGAELSTARTVAEVAEGALHTGAAALEADEVIIGVVIDEGVRLERRSPREGTPGAVTTVSLDQTDEPLVDAMASDKVVVEQSAADMVVHYPRAELLPESGESFAAFPFKTIDGRPLGVVAAVWERPHVVDDTVMATLFTMARLCGQTFQRATLHDVEHQLIEDLRDRVTQPLPEIADIDVAARYRPAERNLEMGGDWYAGTALPDGRLGIVLGDVAGHGIDAVADMAQIRALTSALLATGATLAEVADTASQFVATSTVTLASALFATVDPATRALDYLAAGHVPPLVRYPDGGVEVLHLGRRVLLGLAASPAEVASLTLPEGSMFVAYTDGLVERREDVIDTGINHLAEVLAGLPPGLTADEAADALLEDALASGAVDDDVALVVVRLL